MTIPHKQTPSTKVDSPRVVNHAGNEPRPATLVRGAQAAARVAVKELVEPEVVLPVLIIVEQVVAAVAAPAPIRVARKHVLQAVLDLLRYLAQVHVVAAASRALHLELGPVKEVEPLERLDEQKVDAQPDGASPVAVAAKETAVRVARDIR